MRRMKYGLLALLGVVMVAVAVPAFGTPPDGTTAVENARGVVSDRVKIKESRNTEIRHFTITIAPGGHNGWHSHPGATIVTVKRGTLTLINVEHGSHCVTRVYPAGTSFVEPGHHVHIARNLGTEPNENWVTFTGVPLTGAEPRHRIDKADPGC